MGGSEQSRESIIWDESTRAYIQQVIKEAQIEASKIIQGELDTDDFYNWIQRSNEIIAQMDMFSYNESKLTILSKIVDKNKLQTKFPGNTNIVYKHNPATFFKDIHVKAIQKEQVYEKGKYRTKIERKEVPNWGYFKPELIYLMDEDRHTVIKDHFIMHQKGTSYFVTIKKATDDEVSERIDKIYKDTQLSKIAESKYSKKRNKAYNDAIEQRDEIWEAMFSSEMVKIAKYSEVEITDEFRDLMKSVEEEKLKEEEEDKLANLTPQERRELTGKTVCYSFKQNPRSRGYDLTKDWVLSKKEPVLQDLLDYDKPVVYGTSEHDDYLKSLSSYYSFAVDKALNGRRSYIDMWDMPRISTTPNFEGVSILRFSKRNLKHVKNLDNFVHIDDYMKQNTNNKFAVGEPFVKYLTGRKISDNLDRLKFLANFRQIDEGMYNAYNFLVEYRLQHTIIYDSNYFRNSELFTKLQDYAEKAYEFQVFMRDSNPDEVDRKAKAKELFNDEDVTEARGLDIDVLELLEEVEAYAEPLIDLMKITKLGDGRTDHVLDDVVVKQLKIVIESEGLKDYTITEDKQKFIQQEDK